MTPDPRPATLDRPLVPLAVAERIALEVCDELKCVAEELLIVGSIRRRRPAVHDIDIVIRPAVLRTLHGEPDEQGTDDRLRLRLAGGQAIGRILAWTADGPKLKRFTWHSSLGGACSAADLDVDLYVADERTWPTLVLIRTGSEAHNRMLALRAIDRGMQLKANGDGVLDAHGRPLPVASEADIFAALGMEYVKPADREIPPADRRATNAQG